MATELPTLQVAVVDDEPMVRRGIVHLLNDWPHGRVVLQAANGLEYERACANVARIHMAVVDLHMPVRDGFETINYMSRHQKRTLAVAYGNRPTPSEVVRLLFAGVRGVVCKSNTCEDGFLKALDEVRRTGFHYNDLLSRSLRAKAENERPELAVTLASITRREMDFLRLFALEPFYSLEEVAVRLGITLHGAESLRRAAAKRIGCHRREKMAHFMNVHGLR